MTRLIDADALKKSIEELKRSPWFNSVLNLSWHAGIKEALEIVETCCIDKEPTIDAVPVIRCEDCKWGREISGNIECNADMNNPPEYHGYKWFCPLGERKEE